MGLLPGEVTHVIPDTLFAEFRKLSKEDRIEFLRKARQINEALGTTGLRVGQRVRFEDRGVEIQGIFVRMKQRYAVVETTQGKHGADLGRTVSWNVQPAALVPVEG